MTNDFIEAILANRLDYAKTLIEQTILEKVGHALENKKKTIFEDLGMRFPLTEGRIKIIRVRIRNGKIQRRKKLSNIKGYTFRGGKLKRMTAKERRDRRMGQRRGKIKRRAKMARTRIKRARAMRRRKAMGL